MSNFLRTPIEFLKGVGPNRADLLKMELGIFTFNDLLSYYPFRYIDKSNFTSVRETGPDSPAVQIKGKIQSIRAIGQKRGARLVAKFSDNTGVIDLVWFKGVKWMKSNLKSGEEYVVYGKPSMYGSVLNIVHPEMETLEEFSKSVSGELQPVYHSTEKASNSWLNSKGIEKLMKILVDKLGNAYPETLSSELIHNLD